MNMQLRRAIQNPAATYNTYETTKKISCRTSATPKLNISAAWYYQKLFLTIRMRNLDDDSKRKQNQEYSENTTFHLLAHLVRLFSFGHSPALQTGNDL